MLFFLFFLSVVISILALARKQVFIMHFINKYGLSKAQCDNVWQVVKTTLICELRYDILVSKQLLKE